MLAPRPRRREAPSGVTKISPQQARPRLFSWSFPAVSHDINCQCGGGATST